MVLALGLAACVVRSEVTDIFRDTEIDNDRNLSRCQILSWRLITSSSNQELIV